MRLAVFSDVHADVDALNDALQHIDRRRTSLLLRRPRASGNFQVLRAKDGSSVEPAQHGRQVNAHKIAEPRSCHPQSDKCSQMRPTQCAQSLVLSRRSEPEASPKRE